MRGIISFALIATAYVAVAEPIRVGIYSPIETGKDVRYSSGHEGLSMLLKGMPGYSASFISSLAGEQLARHDVVVLPCLSLGNLDATAYGRQERLHYYHSLPAYAAAGGGVILLSRATGFNYPWSARRSPFPKISNGYFQLSFIPWAKPAWPLQPAEQHSLSNGLKAYELPKSSNFGDGAVVLREGEEGKTFFDVCQGYPIGVTGRSGKGRVVFFGLPLGVHIEKDEAGKPQWKEGLSHEAESNLVLRMIDRSRGRIKSFRSSRFCRRSDPLLQGAAYGTRSSIGSRPEET
jgi:hypothetical protein